MPILLLKFIVRHDMDEIYIEDLIYRLQKRSEIRLGIASRKSVQEGKPDRIAELLEEAAQAIIELSYDTKL